MKELKYTIVSNPFKESEHSKYDYLGLFVTNGTKTLDDCSDVSAEGRPHIDAEFISLVAGLLFEVISDEISDNYRCSVNGVSFATAISGTFPYANSAISDDNELYVTISVGDPIRATVAALEPTKDSEDVLNAAIRRVQDVANGEVGVIHGTGTAIVSGSNISASQPGESIVLADIDTGVVKSVGTVVGSDGHGQRLEVNFAAPFAADDYNLVLTTRGYLTPDAEPSTYSKKVEATEAVELTPEVTVVKCGDLADNVVKFENGAVYVTLANYTPQDGDKLYLEAVKDGAVFETFEVTNQKTASAANSITFANGIENTSEKSNAEWVQYGKRFYLKRGTAEYEKIVTFVV